MLRGESHAALASASGSTSSSRSRAGSSDGAYRLFGIDFVHAGDSEDLLEACLPGQRGRTPSSGASGRPIPGAWLGSCALVHGGRWLAPAIDFHDFVDAKPSHEPESWHCEQPLPT